MDGDLNRHSAADQDGRRAGDATARAAGATRQHARPKPKTVRWFVIVGLLLALVLGGLYGFNRFREQAIATYFASNKPPPAQVAAVKATTETVPRSATGIGSLAAVQQVTVTPEIGGRVTDDPVQAGRRRSKPATRWCSSTTRRSAATWPITRRRRAGPRPRSNAPRRWRSGRSGRSRMSIRWQSQARPGARGDR